MVAPLGFAPRPRGLEPPVLLLHYRASSKTTIGGSEGSRTLYLSACKADAIATLEPRTH